MLVVVSGLTATGKTALLHRLASDGGQVLDLEALAGHHGSAFGNLSGSPQPTHTAFQAAVTRALAGADAHRPLWVEDEGDYLGAVGLPAPLIAAMRVAPCVEVVASVEVRIDRILSAYGRHPIDAWQRAVDRIAPRLGESRTALVRTALRAGDRAAAVPVLLDYYDDGYRHRARALNRRTLTTIRVHRVRGSAGQLSA